MTITKSDDSLAENLFRAIEYIILKNHTSSTYTGTGYGAEGKDILVDARKKLYDKIPLADL